MADISQLGAGVYYVAPPGKNSNRFASFMASWLKTRTPWAEAIFKQRLAALDPTAKLAALAQLDKSREALEEKYLKDLAKYEEDVAEAEGADFLDEKEQQKFNNRVNNIERYIREQLGESYEDGKSSVNEKNLETVASDIRILSDQIAEGGGKYDQEGRLDDADSITTGTFMGGDDGLGEQYAQSLLAKRVDELAALPGITDAVREAMITAVAKGKYRDPKDRITREVLVESMKEGLVAPEAPAPSADWDRRRAEIEAAYTNPFGKIGGALPAGSYEPRKRLSDLFPQGDKSVKTKKNVKAKDFLEVNDDPYDPYEAWGLKDEWDIDEAEADALAYKPDGFLDEAGRLVNPDMEAIEAEEAAVTPVGEVDRVPSVTSEEVLNDQALASLVEERGEDWFDPGNLSKEVLSRRQQEEVVEEVTPARSAGRAARKKAEDLAPTARKGARALDVVLNPGRNLAEAGSRAYVGAAKKAAPYVSAAGKSAFKAASDFTSGLTDEISADEIIEMAQPEGVDPRLLASGYAEREGIENTPNDEQSNNLILLQKAVLEPLKDYGVSSGFRSDKVNKGVGGHEHSRHKDGLAVDMVPTKGKSLADLEKAANALKSAGVVEKVIVYPPEGEGETGHVHIAMKREA